MSSPDLAIPIPKTRRFPLILWPAYVAFILAAIAWGDTNDAEQRVRGALALGTLLFVVMLERWMPLDDRQRPEAERATLHDLGHLVMNALTGILAAASIGAGAYLIRNVAPTLTDFAIWPTGLPWLAQCALAVIAADFLGYWVHRAEHRFPALWAYHVIHHDIERLHILRGTREHFVTSLVRGALIFAPLVLLGAPLESLFAYQVLVTTTGSIAHGNLALQIPDRVHRWLVTPPVHRLHHARERRLSDSNYATVFPIWDRVFGTWTDPTTRPPPEIGAEGESVPDSFLGQLAVPFGLWLGIEKRSTTALRD